MREPAGPNGTGALSADRSVGHRLQSAGLPAAGGQGDGGVRSSALPTGFVATHDPQSLAITNIRFRRWDEARWNGGRWRLQGDGERAQAEIVAGTEKPWEAPYSVEDELGTMPPSSDGIAHIDFMSPWPASVFKLMVATYLMQILDRGQTGMVSRSAGLHPSRCLARIWSHPALLSRRRCRCSKP